jgi:diguanylate cyclase (GGDEF)-like protein
LADRLKTTLALAHRMQSLVAVMFLDLDGFKPVNDRLGHDAGDELLSRLARRLESSLRESDTLARLGGDEFVLVIPVARYDELREIVQRVVNDLRKPFDLGQDEARVDASIGIAVYPNDADTPDALLRLADEAMYLVKKSGRGGYALREAPDSELKVTRWVR